MLWGLPLTVRRLFLLTQHGIYNASILGYVGAALIPQQTALPQAWPIILNSAGSEPRSDVCRPLNQYG